MKRLFLGAGGGPRPHRHQARPLRKLVIAASIILFSATSVGAADLAPRPYTKAPVMVDPAFSWTGFYVGGTVGYGSGDASNDWNFFAQNSATLSTDCFSAIGGGLNAFCASGSDKNRLSGVIGGLQAGYNWQSGSFLAGLATDVQYSGQRSNQVFTTNFSTGGTNPPGTVLAPYTEKLTWLGTLRGKIGLTSDRWLAYATGGLAYGNVEINGSATATSNGGCPGAICPLANFSNKVANLGWTVGGGVERVIDSHWSVMAEYLFVDLGSITSNATTNSIGGGFGFGNSTRAGAGIPAFQGTATINSRVTDNIVRLGINYKP